jgi:hypothetical protein
MSVLSEWFGAVAMLQVLLQFERFIKLLTETDRSLHKAIARDITLSFLQAMFTDTYIKERGSMNGSPLVLAVKL